MDFTEMTIDQLNERRAAIAAEIDTDGADLDALETEARAIREEIEKRVAAEAKRNEIRAAVASGKGETITTFKEERKNTMTTAEVRSSKAYVDAYARYLKTENDAECRALLTDNVSDPLVGSVPAPTFVEGIIADALRESKIMSRVRKTYAKGNVKVGFEISAPAAYPHAEGGDPMEEEQLVLGIVTLIPQTLKKWVSISDEALDTMSGEDYIRYLYEEIARKIVEGEEHLAIGAITGAPTTADATHASVAQLDVDDFGIGDFIAARAKLSAEANDLVIIIDPPTYAAYKTLALSGSFAFDPFEGIEVIFNELGYDPIIGDLSGIMANYPNGDEVQFKRDDTTLMTSDLVRILGRKPVGVGVVRDKFFCRIVKGTS